MGWARLGIWQWLADEKVPLDAVGLDWYSDGGRINCTCKQYPPVDCGKDPTLPCINMLAELEALFPGKPIWINEFNRKGGSCNGTDAIGGGANCAPCAEADGCEDGLSNQAAFVESALREWEELSAAHTIGGVVLYELLDQPHLYPSSEALYGLVRVEGKGTGLRVGSDKPVFDVVRRWNTAKVDDEMATRRPSVALALLAALGLPTAGCQQFWSVLREGDIWWLQRDGQTTLSLGMGGLSTQGECCCGNVPATSPELCTPTECSASTCAFVPAVPPNVSQWELATAKTVTSLGFNSVNCHDVAAIWVAFLSRWQRYRWLLTGGQLERRCLGDERPAADVRAGP